MDNNISLYVFVTVGLIVLTLSGMFAIRFLVRRKKNIARGLLVFFAGLFSLMLIVGLLGSLFLYNYYTPERIQVRVGEFFSIVGPLAMSVVFFLHLRRLKILGNLGINGQAKDASLSQAAAMLLILYCSISREIAVNEDEVVKLNVFWWIVAICLMLLFYYSTKWGGKGFIYRGKAIPFTDVAHAQWDGHWSNTRLKIKLKNNEQELAFTVPAELAPAIDNYLRANFPNP